MGTYTDYLGPKELIPQKKDKFVARAKALLYHSGIMDTEPLMTSDGWAYLLRPYEEEGGRLIFSHSYFDHETWECVALDPTTGAFNTAKVGYNTFGQVCYAINLLREFYAEAPGVATLSGTDPLVLESLGWLNWMFDENWDNSRVFRIQELYRHIPEWYSDYYSEGNKDIRKRVDAFMKDPPAAGQTLDPQIFDLMLKDQLYPRDATPDFPRKIRPVSTLEFVNEASGLFRWLSWRSGMISAAEARDNTDDDRALWWTPDGEIQFSADMKRWIQSIRAEHGQFCDDHSSINIRPTLTRLLTEGRTTIRHPFLFSSFYWFFIDHPSWKHVRASTKQLRAVYNRSVEKKDSTELDRFCAILANKTLRKKVLNF